MRHAVIEFARGEAPIFGGGSRLIPVNVRRLYVPETFGTCSGRRKRSFCAFFDGLVRSKVILIPKTNESDSAANQIPGSFETALTEFLPLFENTMEVIPYLNSL
jgi:hypothetical protein